MSDTKALSRLQSRFEKSIAYAISLQRAIEYHCRGKSVPDRVAEGCPYHAAMLNARLTAPEGLKGSTHE